MATLKAVLGSRSWKMTKGPAAGKDMHTFQLAFDGRENAELNCEAKNVERRAAQLEALQGKDANWAFESRSGFPDKATLPKEDEAPQKNDLPEAKNVTGRGGYGRDERATTRRTAFMKAVDLAAARMQQDAEYRPGLDDILVDAEKAFVWMET